MRRHLLMFDSYLRRRQIVRTDRFEKFYVRLFEQVEEFRKSARDYFGRSKGLLGAAFLVSCGAVVLNASIAPAILYGQGQTPPVAASFILAVLLLRMLRGGVSADSVFSQSSQTRS